MDEIKEEIEDLPLPAHKIKLEKQDVMYEIEEDMSVVKDREFEFINIGCVKEEVDTDSKYSFSDHSHSEVMNGADDTTEPFLKEESELTNSLVEEKVLTSKTSTKCIDEEEYEYDESLPGSEKQLIGKSTEIEESDSSTLSACGDNINSKQKLGTIKDISAFECNVCKKLFLLKRNLNRHMLTHNISRPFQCEICNKAFRLKSNLNSHLFTHTDNRPYQCKICNKCFRQKGSLKPHYLTHTESPFKCEICKKTFYRSCDRNEHIRTHLDRRAFKCEVCKRSFSTKYGLRRHMVIHTDNRSSP